MVPDKATDILKGFGCNPRAARGAVVDELTTRVIAEYREGRENGAAYRVFCHYAAEIGTNRMALYGRLMAFLRPVYEGTPEKCGLRSFWGFSQQKPTLYGALTALARSLLAFERCREN